MAQTGESTPQKPLRLWPGVVIVILAGLGRFVVPAVAPDTMMYGVLAGFVGGILAALWWLFFSRAAMVRAPGGYRPDGHRVVPGQTHRPRVDRGWGDGVLVIPLGDPGPGNGFGGVGGGHPPSSRRTRRATMAATILAVCGGMALIRTGGFTAGFKNDLHWRWTKTPEERLLAQSGIEPVAPPPVPVAAAAPREIAGGPVRQRAGGACASRSRSSRSSAAKVETPSEWPGFRGPHRDGVVPGVRIKTDWAASPPVAALAQADRPGLVVLRGPRRPHLHAGAARSRRGCRLLQPEHRQAGVGTPRPGAIL